MLESRDGSCSGGAWPFCKCKNGSSAIDGELADDPKGRDQCQDYDQRSRERCFCGSIR